MPGIGDFELRYTLLPIRDGLPLRDAAGAIVTPTASLFVRVNPGKVSKMSLQLMEKSMADEATFVPVTELLLGRRYAIDATFFDEDDNPCTMAKEPLVKCLKKQMAMIKDMTLAGTPSPPGSHLIWAKDILLDYTPAPPVADGEAEGEEEEGEEYPMIVKFIPNSKKKPVEKVRFHWGTMTDGNAIALTLA